MASSGNFATLNPLVKYSTGTFSNGNLTYASGSDDGYTSTIGLNFKSYCEVRVDVINNNGGTIGFRGATDEDEYFDVVSFQENYSSGKIYHYKGSTNTAVSIANIGGTVSAGNIIMMAYDPATYKWWVGVNGTWRNSGDPANGTGFVFQGSATMFENMGSIHWGAWNGTHTHTLTFNFGQDSTFGGQETAGGNADGNGFGDFKYSVPTGFLATCSGNMVISDDIDPAGDDGETENPTKQFGIVTYTGNSTTGQTITGLGFKPDLVWAKMTSSSQRNFLTDTNRGITKHLFSDASDDEETDSGMGNTNPIYTAFNDDGFVFGTSGSGPNDNAREYVAWCWKGAGGVNASNAEGSTTCSTQANVKGGFSILTYTGTGSAATLGHGLDSAPEFILAKRRSSPDQTWKTYHVGMGPTKYLTLNEADAAGTSSGMWNDTAPTDTLIHIGNESNVSTSSKDYVIYAWHGVEGYSKFGSYVGNGNADGSFVYTGFRPRMVFMKRFDGGTENWGVFDTARATYNPTSAHSDGQLVWDTTTAGTAGSTHGVDFLSNGFKLRGTGGLNNQSGGSYIFGAWSDVPFKYNNTF